MGGQDTHLQMLQLLSAHMKLLLDAPEHLWRLIEGKKYFSAAWLFLLARVVHRALVRNDEQDEDSWSSRGVNVLVYLCLRFPRSTPSDLPCSSGTISSCTASMGCRVPIQATDYP
jgi:hypothetical protein